MVREFESSVVHENRAFGCTTGRRYDWTKTKSVRAVEGARGREFGESA